MGQDNLSELGFLAKIIGGDEEIKTKKHFSRVRKAENEGNY